MAYNLFIDTNIVLDVFCERVNNFKTSQEILIMGEKGKCGLYTSSSCFVTIAYVLEKYKTSKFNQLKYLGYLIDICTIINPDNRIIKQALDAGFSDIEDAIQYYTALNAKKMDFFITNNEKGFKKANPLLPVMNPTSFVRTYC